jgi:hypothetical protein
MRQKTIPALLLALLATAACEKRTETQTVTDSTGTHAQQTTTYSATMPSVDTAATAEAKRDVQDAAHKAGDAARDAAHATGTALENAGKKIQEKTAPPATKKP